MATPSASSIFNFVKTYPITLCGFSLLFMPSVHRLLLYFTPLLLSTAIFIIAMLSWGPSTESLDQRGKRRSKRPEWTLNGSFKIYTDEDEEEEDEEVADSSIDEKANKKLEGQKHEPDPDSDGESKAMGTATTGAILPGRAEPDPDLGGEGVGTASNGAITDQVNSADCVGTAAGLNGEQHVEAAPFSAGTHQLHGAPDHYRHHHPHDHATLVPINNDKSAAAGDDHPVSEPDHFDYHDAANDHDDDYGDLEANQGDDYYDAEPDPDLQGSDDTEAQAKSEETRVQRVQNDDVRAAVAELGQKLGLVQRAPLISDVDARDHRHAQEIAKGLQTLQAAA